MKKYFSLPLSAIIVIVGFLTSACSVKGEKSTKEDKYLTINEALEYTAVQAKKTLEAIPADKKVPRFIENGSSHWEYTHIYDWTSGFWPGTLWYLYDYTGDEFWKKNAEKYTEVLSPIMDRPTANHDLGFMLYCSYGNGYRLTKNPAYKAILLRAADSLATLYNPNVGTILSWPGKVEKKGWPHNTIIDNMMNLELLFWAAKNGGGQNLYDIAVDHAETTMRNHIRPDYTTYHVTVYDDKTGELLKAVTHQGYADSSMWARGQAWAIYGFTMSYRETGKKEFLQAAKNLANKYIDRLPKDHIPYWDFDAPNIPDEPKDASAAAIVASALFELSTLVVDKTDKVNYLNHAKATLEELSSDRYLSNEKNSAFLLHSTGNKPKGSEVDVSINYADYYFIEALLRSKNLKAGEGI